MKQTVYIMAKQHPVTPPELFAAIVASHFVEKYKHIHSASVKVIVHRWTRLEVGGKPHPHSFYRDGAETRNVEAVAIQDKGIEIRSAISGLLVLKSTGSAFHSFVHDEYTLLQDVDDRILSTSVDCGWKWTTFGAVKDVESAVPKFDKAWDAARKITVETFATENSPSVQNTLYKMCEQILKAVPEVGAVDYSLPNKHYFEIGELPVRFLSCKCLADAASRPELAQGVEQHGQRCGSVCTAVRSEWFDSMHCDEMSEVGAALLMNGFSMAALDFRLGSFLQYAMCIRVLDNARQ